MQKSTWSNYKRSGIWVDPPPCFFKIPTFSRYFFWGASLICDASVTSCNTARNPPNGQPAGRPASPSGGTLLCQASSWRGAAGKGESEFKTIGADIIIVSLLNTFFRLRWRVADTFPDLFPSRCDSWTDLGGKIIQNPLTFSILYNATMLNPFSLYRPDGRTPVCCHGG